MGDDRHVIYVHRPEGGAPQILLAQVTPQASAVVRALATSPAHFPPESHDALALLTSRMAWFAPLVTHTRPLSGVADAFKLTESYGDGVGKMVIV